MDTAEYLQWKSSVGYSEDFSDKYVLQKINRKYGRLFPP